MKGQEQVQCKFYDELARILVKDLPSVLQLDEIPGKPEDDDDFPAYSHQDIGKLKCSLPTAGGVRREFRLTNCGVFTFFYFPYTISSCHLMSID